MNKPISMFCLYRFVTNGREIKAVIKDPLKTGLLLIRSTK